MFIKLEQTWECVNGHLNANSAYPESEGLDLAEYLDGAELECIVCDSVGTNDGVTLTITE